MPALKPAPRATQLAEAFCPRRGCYVEMDVPRLEQYVARRQALPLAELPVVEHDVARLRSIAGAGADANAMEVLCAAEKWMIRETLTAKTANNVPPKKGKKARGRTSRTR